MVTGATQHGGKYIAQRPFKPIAQRLAIGFHVANGRFNGTAAFDLRFQAPRDTASLPRHPDLSASDGLQSRGQCRWRAVRSDPDWERRRGDHPARSPAARRQ